MLLELLVYLISCSGSQFFVKRGICKYGAKCKFDLPKHKGESLKISEHKGDGNAAVTIGT